MDTSLSHIQHVDTMVPCLQGPIWVGVKIVCCYLLLVVSSWRAKITTYSNMGRTCVHVDSCDNIHQHGFDTMLKTKKLEWTQIENEYLNCIFLYIHW